MADDTSNMTREELEQHVFQAVAAFEQVLEAMPDDRASLEALSDAYGQIGDASKARDHLLRLARVLIDERDGVSANELLDRLRALGDEDAEAQALITEIEESGEAAEPSSVETPIPDRAAAAEVSMCLNMSDELAFAWNLMQAGDVTEEEYAEIVQDLTDMSTSETTSTVSILHVLEARGFKALDRIIARISEDTGLPYVTLDSFDIPNPAAALLPVDFMVRRGALVFDLIGNRALAAVLNPYDKGLRRDVETLAGRRCHFCLARASEFDRALERVTSVGVEAIATED